MNDCLFCKIANGEIPCYKIYENKDYLAFLDIFPFAKSHILVIPKKHYDYVWDVEDAKGYMQTVQLIANKMKLVLNNKGILSLVYGEAVPHAHIHLFPDENSKLSDALKTIIPDVKRDENGKLDDAEAKEIASKYKFD